MAEEMDFPKGFIVKAPRNEAPEWVIATISIKRDELIEWLSSKEGDWINLDVKEAKSAHWYASVNTFKPRQENKPGANVPAAEYDSDIPF